MLKDKSWKAEAIIGLIPDQVLDQLADETGVDYSVQKLHGKSVFKLFLFAFLNGTSISLRILEAVFKSEKFKNLFNVQAAPVRHSAIEMRLQNINYRYFERIFQHLISSPGLKAVMFGRKKIQVRKIDSTIVTLSAKLLSFGLDNKTGKKNLKYTLELTGGLPVNFKLFTDQRSLPEEVALPVLIQENPHAYGLSITIFDRGIQGVKTYASLQKQGIHFVSRLTTQNYQVAKELPLQVKDTATLTIQSDRLVRFSNALRTRPELLRVIIGKNKNTGQTIKFVTSVLFLSAAEITEMYRSRWEIETFFKFIKQELNFSHLLSRNQNGIKSVMFLTMIAAILLTLYKKLNDVVGWAVAKIQFIDELESGIMKEWHQEMGPAFSFDTG